MHSQKIERDYKDKKEFYTFLCSDLHFGNKGQDLQLLKKEFDRAKDLDAVIMINGDWGEFIMSGDRKRYTPGGDKYSADNACNRTIEEAFNFLKDYAENIAFIGCGNHEVSVSKFHNFDPTQTLVTMLNIEKKTNIQHGQYCGFITLSYAHSGGCVRGKKIYYNHGQGGSAEVTKGIIDLNRHLHTKESDIVWIGHKHTKLVLPCEPVLYQNQSGTICERQRVGIITGAYSKNISEYDANKTGYKVNFGEERMRSLQSTGGVLMKHYIQGQGHELHQEFIV